MPEISESAGDLHQKIHQSEYEGGLDARLPWFIHLLTAC